MSVGKLVKRPPITVAPDVSIREAAKIMAQNKIGFLVITDRFKEKILGVVSERDILRSMANEIDPSSPVDIISTKKVISVEYDAGYYDAVEKMIKNRIRHLVVTKEGKLYGVVSVRDFIEEEDFLKMLASYSESGD